jgi:Gram-negative bacterial TonB protein C-terminal
MIFASGLCAGCQNQPLQVVSAITTSETSLLNGHRDARQEFGPNETVVVFVYVTWPNVTSPGGTHFADWRWFRGNQLVSESQNHVTFKRAPGDLWTRRAAASLGPGDYRVETRLDDQVLATNDFKISATPISAVYDKKVANSICRDRPDPDPSQASLVPIQNGNPIYPDSAFQTEVPGCAVVLVTIDQSGHPNDVRLVSEYPQGWGFGDAAIGASRNYVFPNGHSGWKHYIIVRFELADANH